MAENVVKENCRVLREFIMSHSDFEKMPKDGRKALKAALNLAEQLLLDIHRIAEKE